MHSCRLYLSVKEKKMDTEKFLQVLRGTDRILQLAAHGPPSLYSLPLQ